MAVSGNWLKSPARITIVFMDELTISSIDRSISCILHVVFRTIEWLMGDAAFYLKFWVKLTHPASKTEIFTQYSLVAAQPLELVKKVQL